MEIYSVGALTRYLKERLDADPFLQDLWIEGEVSNFVVSTAGHRYFTLKDANSQLRCVFFRGRLGNSVDHRPANGEAVVAHGHISVYEVQGAYQFFVDLLQPVGVGTRHLEFELLRGRLEAQGLFDAARKRPLPRYPRRIGVVTSSTGAVLHDIINVLRRRYPLVELILAPTAVQGDEAAAQICEAIGALNDYGDVDVTIVARGGGSLEELWPFNQEIVARAIYGSRIPVVTGVGHETDVTIADLVADLRAPTPSAAAELIVPDRRECRGQVALRQRHLAQVALGRCATAREAVRQASVGLEHWSPRAFVDRQRQQADDLALRAQITIKHLLENFRIRVEGRASQLGSLDPTAVLGRGYSICRLGSRIVRSVHQVSRGDPLNIQVSDGQLETQAL